MKNFIYGFGSCMFLVLAISLLITPATADYGVIKATPVVNPDGTHTMWRELIFRQNSNPDNTDPVECIIISDVWAPHKDGGYYIPSDIGEIRKEGTAAQFFNVAGPMQGQGVNFKEHLHQVLISFNVIDPGDTWF